MLAVSDGALNLGDHGVHVRRGVSRVSGAVGADLVHRNVQRPREDELHEWRYLTPQAEAEQDERVDGDTLGRLALCARQRLVRASRGGVDAASQCEERAAVENLSDLDAIVLVRDDTRRVTTATPAPTRSWCSEYVALAARLGDRGAFSRRRGQAHRSDKVHPRREGAAETHILRKLQSESRRNKRYQQQLVKLERAANCYVTQHRGQIQQHARPGRVSCLDDQLALQRCTRRIRHAEHETSVHLLGDERVKSEHRLRKCRREPVRAHSRLEHVPHRPERRVELHSKRKGRLEAGGGVAGNGPTAHHEAVRYHKQEISARCGRTAPAERQHSESQALRPTQRRAKRAADTLERVQVGERDGELRRRGVDTQHRAIDLEAERGGRVVDREGEPILSPKKISGATKLDRVDLVVEDDLGRNVRCESKGACEEQLEEPVWQSRRHIVVWVDEPRQRDYDLHLESQRFSEPHIVRGAAVREGIRAGRYRSE